MKNFYPAVLVFFLFTTTSTFAQNYFLRGDVGLLSTLSSAENAMTYFTNRHQSFGFGWQLHRKLSQRSTLSVGLYGLQYDRFYLSGIACFADGGTQYFYTHYTYNHLTIPLIWHRKFGRNNRFEYSSGIYYSRAFRAKDLAGNENWLSPRQSQSYQLGISLGIQYSLIQWENLDISISYRSFAQVYNPDINSQFHTTRMNATNYLSSFFSINCTMPL